MTKKNVVVMKGYNFLTKEMEITGIIELNKEDAIKYKEAIEAEKAKFYNNLKEFKSKNFKGLEEVEWVVINNG